MKKQSPMLKDKLHTVASSPTKSVPFFISFFRSQFVSILATVADFLVTIFLKEFFSIWYVLSNAFGATTGAIISFLLGRNWAFERQEGNWVFQAFRYTLTAISSVVLNTYGVYLVTEQFGFQYLVSKAIVAILVGVFFNFLMFRYFVFR